MKKYSTFILVLIASCAFAQDTKVKLDQLAVPTSPAFILTDITPTLVQNPNTPKAFALGVAQSYQESGTGFPNNYSAEFAPYWWVRNGGGNIYSFLGIKTIKDIKGYVTDTKGENPFSGLKFTSVSIAFINKDLIPDTFKSTQKIFSVGIRTTLVKIHLKGYTQELKGKMDKWIALANRNIDTIAPIIARDALHQDSIIKSLTSKSLTDLFNEINELITQKPIFSWDIAAATATYGVNDQEWVKGRTGVWTTMSSYIPLALGDKKNNKNYFNLNFTARYLTDEFQKNDSGIVGYSDNFDIGGKAALEFDQLSIGVEMLYRYTKGVADLQNRTVGVINYRLTDNLYINGSFGKNFSVPDKLIATFGINWGIGKEQLNLPSATK